jgi:stage III sporulation protein AH
LPTISLRRLLKMTGIKRKQIIVLSLILMIVIAGYLQYSYKKSSSSVSDRDNGKLGEAVYVDSQNVVSEEPDDTIVSKDKKDQKEIEASQQANDFFAQAYLDREIARSRDTDALKEISEDPGATSEIKAQAYEEMMRIIANSQIETKIETLVKERGFEDVIAVFAGDGSLDIIVKTPALTSAETAQIADIAMRHAQLQMDQIHIKPVY